jgi:hypothetical protein
MGRTCSTHRAEKNSYRVLVGKPGEKRQLRRSRRRWEDNIKMDLGRVTSQVVNYRIPLRQSVFNSRSRVGFVVDKVELGQVFSEYFGYTSQFSFRQLLHALLSSAVGTIGQLVAGVTSGLCLTPPQEAK